MIERLRPPVSATMRIDYGAERWMYRQALRNLWRVSGFYDLDDLVQEGLLYWHKVATYYRHVDDRRHMMRLFKTTYSNRLHALAIERTRRLTDWNGKQVQEVSLDELVERRDVTDHGEVAADIETRALLPEPVQRMLAFMESDEGARRLRALYRRYADGTRDTFNQRMARLIGWVGEPPDFRQLMRDYLEVGHGGA